MTRSQVWIHGVSGRVGQELSRVIQDRKQFDLAGGSSETFAGGALHGSKVDAKTLGEALSSADVIIDFSSAEANQLLFDAIKKAKLGQKAILIGTTQLSSSQIDNWKVLAKSSDCKILIAPNTSVGVFILTELVKSVAPLAQKFGFDMEIVETHHNKKIDIPSGTALALAESVNASIPKKLKIETHHKAKRGPESLGIHSIRGGGVFGEHDVRIISDNEELNLSHRAFNRTLFAEGALTLTGWLLQQPPGFYQLKDIELKDL